MFEIFGTKIQYTEINIIITKRNQISKLLCYVTV